MKCTLLFVIKALKGNICHFSGGIYDRSSLEDKEAYSVFDMAYFVRSVLYVDIGRTLSYRFLIMCKPWHRSQGLVEVLCRAGLALAALLGQAPASCYLDRGSDI